MRLTSLMKLLVHFSLRQYQSKSVSTLERVEAPHYFLMTCLSCSLAINVVKKVPNKKEMKQLNSCSFCHPLQLHIEITSHCTIGFKRDESISQESLFQLCQYPLLPGERAVCKLSHFLLDLSGLYMVTLIPAFTISVCLHRADARQEASIPP